MASQSEVNETYLLADQVMGSHVPPFAMSTLIELGVLQVIHDYSGSDGISPIEIATRIQAQNVEAPVMLDRMLRLLATYSVVSCTVIVSGSDGGVIERRYKSSPLTRFFVPDHDGISLAPMSRMLTNKVYLESWSKLKESVFEGGTAFNRLHGKNTFEYSSAHHEFNAIFNEAMSGHSTLTMKRILETYKGFTDIKLLVDVAGGHGQNIGLITSKYPSIKGINFDLPHVIQYAPKIINLKHIGGDMFESIPKGDAIFLKWILHDWNDEECIKILKNCYKSLPENGKVIVVDSIISDEPDTSNYAKVVSHLDVTMMTQGGKERTVKELESLANAAGFLVFKLDVCVSFFWVMEFYKK